MFGTGKRGKKTLESTNKKNNTLILEEEHSITNLKMNFQQ